MKRFRFRLARLERLRELRAREARAGLLVALRARDAESAATRTARDRVFALEAERPELDGPVDAATLKQLAALRDAARERLAVAGERLAAAEGGVDRAAATHADAAREHRALERLHEKRRRRWNEERELEERKFLDETFLLRRGAREDEEERRR